MSRTVSFKQTHVRVVELFCNKRTFRFPTFILYHLSVSASGSCITMTTYMFSIMYILRSLVFDRYAVQTCDGFPVTVTEVFADILHSFPPAFG